MVNQHQNVYIEDLLIYESCVILAELFQHAKAT